MARAIVTPELSETLRNLRVEHKIHAKDLAEHIGKSRAFISRLENGTLNTIDPKDLLSIIRFIMSSDEDIDSILEEIYSVLEIKYTPQEIREQLWFTNYDTVGRSIPISAELLAYLNQLINELDITHEYLLSRINANESLPENEREDSTIPFNQWYPKLDSSSPFTSNIKIKLSLSDLDEILSGERDTSQYIYLMGILFYMFKIQQYKDQVSLTADEYKDLYIKTIDCLNSYKFYSIAEKRRLLASKLPDESDDSILSVFDIENRELISKINHYFKLISEVNIKYANRSFKGFCDNLDIDMGFMMAIINMNYFDLKSVNVSNKKKLLGEIQELITKYASLPDEVNSIETY